MPPEGTMEYYTDQTRPAFLYVCYSFLLIFSKFCDLSLLHWPLGGGGGSAVRKIYCAVLTLPHCGPWNHQRDLIISVDLMYTKLSIHKITYGSLIDIAMYGT
jgi:hypothetical protein